MTDAWEQVADLEEKYTEEVEVRRDLVVTALGLERGVMFTLIETDHDYDTLDKRHYRHHSTQRNVSTMRELAQALLDACDFVEQANPVWAQLLDRPVVRELPILQRGSLQWRLVEFTNDELDLELKHRRDPQLGRQP